VRRFRLTREAGPTDVGGNLEPRLYTPAVAAIDMQLMHSSRITPPSYLHPPEKDWLFEAGEESQNVPEYYTVAFLIASGS